MNNGSLLITQETHQEMR